MIAGIDAGVAGRLARWTASASLFAMLATAVWFIAGLLDSLAIGLIVVAALFLPVAASLAQPRTTTRRSGRR